ncbi:hypothetical protein EDC19_0010 [Natranaerovirga hydrolytica]|uniref:GAF domain-containing protein n=1 Tax=Natranaerovirga hydrolytica TaxID=680378 RepID=A0A4R1N1M8_9FIRM|nr:hypothetical protein [Natranaerovirga hydrolytica]TCL00030.1 hypothetical protein EDC19_0010 [Natranaerovirga hydrolytica]
MSTCNENVSNTNDNTHYESIFDAIEFFSQKFNMGQIIDYAFNFCNDLLKPSEMVLWRLNEEQTEYIISHQKGIHHSFSFSYNEDYNKIVYFHAGLLYKKHIVDLLPNEIYNLYTPDFCIPLVMDKKFYGFITLKRTDEYPFHSEDYDLACALMNLFYNSLTHYFSSQTLENTKSKLDEKIFNLFAINQSTKAILSERSLVQLYDLAISIFSELTQSRFTTFFIKNPISENYDLTSYKDVNEYTTNLDITLYEKPIDEDNLPILVDMSNDFLRGLFVNKFFNGNEIIDKINPSYIVLLKKSSQLVGFVTLGKKVNDKDYDSSIFELVESLASATYVAINNAFYIEEINKQKNVINNKLNDLIKLNNLLKTINSAQSSQNIIKLVMRALTIHFDVEMGFFATYDQCNSAFNIAYGINIGENHNLNIGMFSSFNPLFEGDTIIEYKEDKVYSYFTRDLIHSFNLSPSGVILVPVYINGKENLELMGFFAILRNKNNAIVTEENIVTFNAIATHIGPIIYQLKNTEAIKDNYCPNYTKQFLSTLKREIEDAKDFSLELYVIHIYTGKKVAFNPITTDYNLKEQFTKVFPIDNGNIFIITNEASKLPWVETFSKESNTYCTTYTLDKDFIDYDNFINLF